MSNLLGPAPATKAELDGKANSTHNHSAADMTSGTLPDARLPGRLGTTGATVTDWNSATTNGFYFSTSSAANKPPGTTGNLLGTVIATGTTVTQRVFDYQNDAAADTMTWRRDMQASTWTAWSRVRESEAELDARYQAKPVTADVTYYVATTGSNSNDGLTAGAPFLTIQKAVDTAAARSIGNDIKVLITVAAGSYNGRVIIPEFTEKRLNLVIQGPEVAHPGVPTVTQTEGTNASASAFINRNPNTKLTVRNIHFTGYRGTSSSSGITVTNGGKLFTENCHFTDCFWGVSGQASSIDIKGGIFTRCGFLGTSGTGTGAGFRSLMGNVHAIGVQGAGNLTAGPNFVDCKTGGHIQETSTGHVDWSTFTNCERGLILRVNSRANVDGSSFTGSTVGITIETGSNAFLPAATVFSGCTNNYVVNSSGSVSGTAHTINGVEESYVRQEAIAWGSYTAVTHTGTLTETDLANLTLKGGVWRGNSFAGTNAPAARLRIQTSGTLNGTAGTKTIRIRYGTGIATVAFTATEVGSFVYDGYVTFTSAQQTLRAEGRRHLGTNMRIGTATTATDVTVDQSIRLTAELGATADSIVFDAIEISRA